MARKAGLGFKSKNVVASSYTIFNIINSAIYVRCF